ncbi:origin recognition complex subunit Orc5 [Apiospora arundinis]|uniref:Origin recognition complex subunit Orc5 n=1 Tax=Apiospora arundinis TaxID=335852 RepID=A0ABR2IGA0_9PEZI
MGSLFQLPDELLATLLTTYPCREPQIRTLATLVYPFAAPCRNLILHGTEATGKSAIATSLLAALGSGETDETNHLSYAVVKSPECVTARHLFERTTAAVAHALQWPNPAARCETLAALTVELSKMLKYVERGAGWRFVLVFDAIDRQKESPHTLLPALARLSEIIPNLTTIFILTAPSPALLRTASTPHLYFPPYTKAQYTTILSTTSTPPSLPNTTSQETQDLYARFVAAVHDSLAKPASRTLPRLQQACQTLWPRFTTPIAAGTHKAREFSKLLIAARAYLQDESVLAPSIIVTSAAADQQSLQLQPPPPSGGLQSQPGGAATTPTKPKASKPVAGTKTTTDLSNLLPSTAKLLLLAAYLASHNAPRHDQTVFSTWHHGRRRRGGGVSSTLNTGRRGPRPKHRKIARKLLGPGVFVLERMVAIYAAVRREWIAEHQKGSEGLLNNNNSVVDGDVGMAIATLASLRLLLRVGGGGAAASGSDMMDRGGRWRVGVGWEVVRGVGRSLGIEVEDWLVE